KIAGILAAIEDGMYHPSMKTKMADLEARKAQLTAFLEDTPEPPALRLHPRLSDLYREKIANLSAALQEPGMKLEATQILRSLITEIRMVPEPDAPGGHEIELLGELAGILALSEADTTKPPRLARAGKSVESETMVAGARIGHCFAMSRALNLPYQQGLRSSVNLNASTFDPLFIGKTALPHLVCSFRLGRLYIA